MQNSKIILTIGMSLCVLNSIAQNKTNSYKGQVRSATEVVPFATVKIDQQIIRADKNGNFSFTNNKSTVDIQITAVGKITVNRKQVVLSNHFNSPILIEMHNDSQGIDEVEVMGLTKIKEINRQAFNVTAIDATKLYNSTLNIADALDKVSGVRVRESGGVGSNTSLTLNGFSGNHIRFFLDGIPMDNFGTSFQINNIPINLAERVEVYKGVVPIWLGSDALGGAVNIVTSTKARTFVDASYSYGSFNTHRTAVNAGVTNKNGLTVLLNAYQNYSDNDYTVTTLVSNINTWESKENVKVKRFHDKYHNEALVAQVGVSNKSYADKLLLGITLGQNYKEIQTGARMVSVFGGWHRRGNTVMPTLKYQKNNLIKGLDVTLNANYNFGKEQNIDTLNRRYDWYGNYKEMGTNGERSRQLYVYKNNEGIASLAANYRLSDRQSLSLSNVATTFNRKGEDELNPQNSNLEQGQRSIKNVMGLGYSYDVKDHWSTTVFGKMITQNNKLEEAESASVTRFGYGLASTYFIQRDLQIKASYEMTNRMPTSYEIFGDLENQEANGNLKPERSHNINLGAIYGWKQGDDHRFSVAGNLIYRYSFDFIYNRLNNNQSKLVADNRDGVSTRGGDLDVHYSYKNFLNFGGSLTYQYLQNKQKYEPGYTGVSPVYNDQMPNIPYLFGNTNVDVSLHDFGGKNNKLTVGYNLLYVHDFWLYWPSRGNSSANKKQIPKQLSHDVNLVYSLGSGKYNIGVEGRNLANANLYDNFSLQKPGRSFAINLRYYFQRDHK